MGLKLFHKGKETQVERKASAAARVAVWGSVGRVAWSPRDTVSLTRNGFQGNPVGFRAVHLIAEAAARGVPAILISNYADAQAAAVAAGGKPGLGKTEVRSEKASRAIRGALALD